MSTPPEEQTPFFSAEQLRGLRDMYQQAPWLYSEFQTPQSSVQRPAFIEQDVKGRPRRLKMEDEEEVEEKRMLEEHMKQEVEKDQLNRYIQQLMLENQGLREQTTQVMMEQKKRDEKRNHVFDISVK